MKSILIGLAAFLMISSSSSLMTSSASEIQVFAQNKTIASIEKPQSTGSEEVGVIMMIIVAAIMLSGVAIWEVAKRRRKKQKKARDNILQN
jgi:tryptophan-rich sensory protein